MRDLASETKEDLGFDEASRFYRFRTPYIQGFFSKVSEKLGFNSSTVVLDIACGAGSLSAGLSAFANKVVGIDASAYMLSHAEKSENIEYVQCDLLTDSFACRPKAHHALIGRAIPYLPRDNLQKTLENSLFPEGKILVCGSMLARSAPWVTKYRALRYNYGPRHLEDVAGEKN